jgi:hypothetical protein
LERFNFETDSSRAPAVAVDAGGIGAAPQVQKEKALMSLFPFQLDFSGSILVESGSYRVQRQVRHFFRAERLWMPEEDLDAFVFLDLKVGKNSQQCFGEACEKRGTDYELPARLLAGRAFTPGEMEGAAEGIILTMFVKNIASPRVFRARLEGHGQADGKCLECKTAWVGERSRYCSSACAAAVDQRERPKFYAHQIAANPNFYGKLP